MEQTYEVLKQLAYKHIWQNPSKDKQVIIELSRLSPKNGYIYSGKVGWDEIVTPTEKGYYHFYQIGDNLPSSLSLFSDKNKWYRLSDWCKLIDLVIHCYNKDGKLIPNDHLYMYRMYNDNIIIAILRNDKIFELNDYKVYFHLYRNFYYLTKQLDNKTRHIEFLSNIQSAKKSSQMLFDYANLVGKQKKGAILRVTNNGYLVDGLEIKDIKNGDVTEIHYDMSVWGYHDFPLDELRTFKSSMDQKTKYLLHPPKKKSVEGVVYRDDIDIYVCKWPRGKDDRLNKKKCKGLYYHRNQEDSVRMVTHRDYSVPVPYVQSLIEKLDPHPNLQDFFIRVYFRYNGIPKPVVDDCNNIMGLYNMSDNNIYNAMVKVNSTIPEWTADKLESSAYTAVMRSYRHEITPALVLDALGYNTGIKLLADPNATITESPNGNYFKVPLGLQDYCTVFEYDANGLLLGWYLHHDAVRYYPRENDCVYVEFIAGKGGDDLNIHVGRDPFDLVEETSYRFYYAKKEGEEIVSEWTDITGDSRVLIDGLRCTMNVKATGEEAIALGDNLFLCYEQQLDGTDGIYDFRITYGIDHVVPLPIPCGKLDLWMNGKALVENIDYYVDFPYVNIVNKKYVKPNDYQKVTVRCTGFPFLVDGSLRRVFPRETGFVQYGKVSVDTHYDLHRDKILRTVVNGGVFHPSVIPFDDNGEIDVHDYMTDGLPYSIETPYVALNGTMNISFYQMQLKDYDQTARMNAYLTSKIKLKERKNPPFIPTLYPVFSTFLSKITSDLKYGRLQSPPTNTGVQVIDKIVNKYKKYLTMDPVYRGYDDKFVTVHPHNEYNTVELSARDIEFLKVLNKLYLNDKVDLSVFYRVRKGK